MPTVGMVAAQTQTAQEVPLRGAGQLGPVVELQQVETRFMAALVEDRQTQAAQEPQPEECPSLAATVALALVVLALLPVAAAVETVTAPSLALAALVALKFMCGDGNGYLGIHRR